MTAKECLQILRDIKDVAFATVDEKGMPHARMIDVMLVEEEKLYFCTARGKNFYRQLENLPRTEITGMNREYQMVRLSGKVKRLADQKKWIDRIFRENPWFLFCATVLPPGPDQNTDLQDRPGSSERPPAFPPFPPRSKVPDLLPCFPPYSFR